MCFPSTWIADVNSYKSFPVLFINFCHHLVDLLPQQVHTSASTHTENLMEAHILHAEMGGLITEE